jgi:hypothetical protein
MAQLLLSEQGTSQTAVFRTQDFSLLELEMGQGALQPCLAVAGVGGDGSGVETDGGGAVAGKHSVSLCPSAPPKGVVYALALTMLRRESDACLAKSDTGGEVAIADDGMVRGLVLDQGG